MINKFEKDILNLLLDKYEKSKLSKGGTQVKRNITLTIKEKIFDSYRAIDSYNYIDENDAIIRKLEDLGFIEAKFDGYNFESLSLKLEKVNDIYSYLGRSNPLDELESVKDVIRGRSFDNFVSDFVEFLKKYIDEKYTFPKAYFENASQLELILTTFECLFSLEEDMKMRDFSVKFLGDSKIFETIKTRIIKIVRDFDSREYESEDEILISLGIIKNSSYVFVKNNLILKINNSIIDLNALGFEMSLSDEMINNLEIIPSNVKKVITVENLTSFYSLNDKNAVIVYLAGFHNHTKQQFLLKIFNTYQDAEYYHFGDIDAGGFWIFNNLRKKTQIPFKPFRMNIEELKNSTVLKHLTNNDVNRLTKMRENKDFYIFKECIDYMLENNVKLEQEILS